MLISYWVYKALNLFQFMKKRKHRESAKRPQISVKKIYSFVTIQLGNRGLPLYRKTDLTFPLKCLHNLEISRCCKVPTKVPEIVKVVYVYGYFM